MKKQKQQSNEKVTVLAFDSTYRLTAIFQSISEASRLTGNLRQSLMKAASGEIISVGGRYWRTLPRDYEVEPDDLGGLTLFEYDEFIGEDRRIYATRGMLKSSVMLESEYLAIQEHRRGRRP